MGVAGVPVISLSLLTKTANPWGNRQLTNLRLQSNRTCSPTKHLIWSFSLRMKASSISKSAAMAEHGGSGGDGDGLGGGGSEGEGGSSGGETETNSTGVKFEDGVVGEKDDVIILSVGGMTCNGCVASVKRILESKAQVSSATVNLDTESAAVYAVPDAKLGENWRQELGEELATHLTTCGFKSNFSYASVNEA
ncbi:hypothetical protein ZOSMA_53G00300 [Zostera marina]|uniref:HMA domain-containing protein n=1 Tax=Zostera marina TaxID=29655 RepID=A0A0K9NX49_ZOSMR|nr:hypothetical protein ZOSMA_53G00300 [Zostera marina]